MSNPIAFRPDAATEEALAVLTADGTDRSQAIRNAILDAAAARRRDELRRTGFRLADDPAYLAEIRAVREDLAPLRAW